MSEEQEQDNIVSGIITGDWDGVDNPNSYVFSGPAGYVGILNAPKKYKWRPKEDITPYEIALCLPVVSHFTAYQSYIEYAINALPERARRHFELV